METTNLESRFLEISIAPKTVKNILKNTKISNRLAELLDLGGISKADKNVGNLLYTMSTRMPEVVEPHTKFLVEYIRDGKIDTPDRLCSAFEFLKNTPDDFEIVKFEEECGVGIIIPEEEVTEFITKLFKENMNKIKEEKCDFNFSSFIHKTKEELRWADGRTIVEAISKKTSEILGENLKKSIKSTRSENP